MLFSVGCLYCRIQLTVNTQPCKMEKTAVFVQTKIPDGLKQSNHAFLNQIGRVQYDYVMDDEAIDAFFALSRLEGIIPALESAHALGALAKVNFKPEEVVVLTVSGRGDKDMDTYINYKLS